MLLADMRFDLDPAWPWSLPRLGMPALLAAALLLAALTVWTYLGVKNATWRRVGIVLCLRLAALLVAFCMMMRPSFAFTQLEGVELTKLLVVFDASESMNVAEIDGKPTRWQHATKLWALPEVQRRLDRLRSEQKIEVVKYFAAEDLRPDEADAIANGKRTDVGAWLHQLRQKHAHEMHLRGIVLVSDGADNGTRFSVQEQARHWRGIAPIRAFGVGDPSNPKFKKDLALTSLKVKPEPIFVKSNITIDAVAQAPGFEKTEVEVIATIQEVGDNKPVKPLTTKKVVITQEKDQPLVLKAIAPEDAGEYKVTLKITPHADEANKENNEISTYVQVIKEKINILWVDRPRVWEPTAAIRLLNSEPRFEVHYFLPPTDGKGDALKFYEFDQRHYDVIIIGDLSAQQFSLGDAKIFDTITELVMKNKRTGLLMLGGTETFSAGGWQKLAHLLPVKLPDKAEYSANDMQAVPAPLAPELPFLKLDADAKKNARLWAEEFEPLKGLAPLGTLLPESTALLKEKNGDRLVMAFTRKGDGGHVVVFGGDSTWHSWRNSTEAVAGYKTFWRQLVLWLANQEDRANVLQVTLDKRRLNANAADVLNFTLGLRGKSGIIGDATFTAKIVGPKDHSLTTVRDGQLQRGSWQAVKEPGEYRLIVDAKAKIDGKDVTAHAEPRFLVALDDIELLRPIADHEMLSKIAAASDGRFEVLDEANLLRYLDELQGQVNRESRHKTTHWPDWTRVPASPNARDQMAGLWSSFALIGLLLFSGLIGGEWLLRRLWGWV